MGFKIFENNLLIKVMLNFFYSQNAYFLKCIETSFFLGWGGGCEINEDNGYKTNFI